MKTRLRFLCLAALAGPGLALAGCATGGVGGRSDVGPEAASRQVAAAVFVQEWAQLLWGLRTAQTSTEPPVMGPPVFHPDGSITQTITGADKTVGKDRKSVVRERV